MRNCQAIAPSPARLEGAGGTGGPGRGAGGRRQGQGGPRDRPLRAAGSRVAISRAGRRPPAHTAARPFKADPPAPGTPAAPQATTRGNKRRAGGPPPTGTHSGPAHSGRPRGGRRSGGARNTSGATRNAARTRTERIPYSPRNALIAGISRTACTRPAR